MSETLRWGFLHYLPSIASSLIWRTELEEAESVLVNVLAKADSAFSLSFTLGLFYRENGLRIYNPEGAENCYRFSGEVLPGAYGRGFDQDRNR
jgi:hypothetical protein